MDVHNIKRPAIKKKNKKSEHFFWPFVLIIERPNCNTLVLIIEVFHVYLLSRFCCTRTQMLKHTQIRLEEVHFLPAVHVHSAFYISCSNILRNSPSLCRRLKFEPHAGFPTVAQLHITPFAERLWIIREAYLKLGVSKRWSGTRRHLWSNFSVMVWTFNNRTH